MRRAGDKEAVDFAMRRVLEAAGTVFLMPRTGGNFVQVFVKHGSDWTFRIPLRSGRHTFGAHLSVSKVRHRSRSFLVDAMACYRARATPMQAI